MEKHDSHFPDELLSAYLDDELSEEERGLVERAVASSLPLKATLAQLKLLKEKLSSMPRFELDADFRKRVCENLNGDGVSLASEEVDSKTNFCGSATVFWASGLAAAAILILICVSVQQLRKKESQLAVRSVGETLVEEPNLIEQPESDEATNNHNIRPMGDVANDSDAQNLNRLAFDVYQSDRISVAPYLAELATNVQSNSYRFVAMVDADQSVDIEGELSEFFDRRKDVVEFKSEVNEEEIRYYGVSTTISELERFNKKWESKVHVSMAEASEVLRTTALPNVRYHFWKKKSTDVMARQGHEPSENDLFIDLEDSDGQSHTENRTRFRRSSLPEDGYGFGFTAMSDLDVANGEERIRVLFTISPGFESFPKNASE